MSSSLSLRSLLDSDKLSGPNFDSWYRRIRIVLEHERILYVIQDPAPEEPAPTARAAVKDAYVKYLSDRTTVRCIMLAAMNDEFSRRFEEASPQDILQKLKESFGAPDDVERYRVSSTIFNARMAEGASVTDHVLCMIEQIERLARLGCPFHDQLGKDAILNSLPPSYLPFLDHYRLTRPVCNYHELLGLLQTFEKDHRLQKKAVHFIGGSRPRRSSSRKGRKRRNVIPHTPPVPVQRAGPHQPRRKKVDQSSAECFFCKKRGHWRRNCPAYLATLDPNRPRKKKQHEDAAAGTSS